jgi:hypothetical protein
MAMRPVETRNLTLRVSQPVMFVTVFLVVAAVLIVALVKL